MIEQGLRQYDPSEAEELVSGTTTLGTGTPEGRDVGSDGNEIIDYVYPMGVTTT